jgi:hypothetical protein
MNRKIFMSSISIVAATTILGVSAFAADLADANAPGDSLASASPNLEISNTSVDSGFSSGVSGALGNLTNIIPDGATPGGNAKTVTFYLDNNGTLPLTLAALFSNVTGSGKGGTGFLENDEMITISCTNTTTGSESVGPLKFSSFETTAQTLTGGTLAAGDTATCILTADLPNGDNDFNQTLNYNATVGGN